MALALGCGLVASIGISQVMDRRNAAEAPAAETEPVFVAGVDINYNDQMTPEKVKIEEWPKDKIHADALRTLDQIKGQRVAHKIFAGEQIRAGKLMGSRRAQSAWSDKIPPGYRVMPGASRRRDRRQRPDSAQRPRRRAGLPGPQSGRPASTRPAPRPSCKTSACSPSIRSSSGKARTSRADRRQDDLAAGDSRPGREGHTGHRDGHGPPGDAQPRRQLGATPSGANIRDIFGTVEKMDRAGEEDQTAARDQATQRRRALLARQQQRNAGAAAAAAQAPGQRRLAADSRPWKMTLIEGSEVRQVELNSEDQLPNLAARNQ